MKSKPILKGFEADYWIIFLVMFLTGFSSLLYEIVLLLVFSTIIGATEISLAIILSSFLLGLAIGGLLGGFISKKNFNHILILIFIEIIIAIFAFSAMFLMKNIALIQSRSFLQFLFIIILVLIPTFSMGMEIPIAVRILSARRKKHPTGFVYFSDTLGGVLGSLFSGLLVIPVLGFHGAMIFGGILNIIAALMGMLLNIKLRLRKLLSILIMIILIISTIFVINSRERFYNLELDFFDTIYNKKDFYYAKTIYSVISPFQSIIIANSPYYGNQLYINGELQVSDYDSLIYHEYLVLPSIAAHPHPKKVLVIGGGDGGALYQILKYNFTKIEHVELDEKVIEVSRSYLKNVHNGSLDNPRVNTITEDGRYYLANNQEKYDIIVIDLPDPLKLELSALYSQEFYQLVYNSLEEDGIMVTQANSPYHYLIAHASIYKTIKSVFPNVKSYTIPISSMSSMGYIIASKNIILENVSNRQKIDGKWYNSNDHEKIFYEPEFLREFLENNSILISTDTNPIIHIYSQPNYYVKGILDIEK